MRCVWVLLACAMAERTKCPDNCNCNGNFGKKSGKFGHIGNLFNTKCTSCKKEYKEKFWGDTCTATCSEYSRGRDSLPSDMEGLSGSELAQQGIVHYGFGNCDGCKYEGGCVQCKKGWWGINSGDEHPCKMACSENCVHPVTMTNQCNQEHGMCFGCKVGYCNPMPRSDMPGCMTPCPENCKNPEACQFGDCTCDGCKAGHWGVACEAKCPDHGCESCIQETGECTRCKSPGFWGTDPHDCHTCPANCADQHCQMTNGNCHHGCQDSKWWGEKCENACPHTIKPDGERVENCENGQCRADGSCKCAIGKFGKDCSRDCPIGCENNKCNKFTGECNCKPGFWDLQCLPGTGETCVGECDRPCSEHCLNGVCGRDHGNCVCEAGWYGQDCDQMCSPDCATGKCHQEDGTCTDGCRPGFWGTNCLKECDPNCRDGNCDKNNGFCKCKQHWWGTSNTDEDTGLKGPQCQYECPHCKLLPAKINGELRSACKQETGHCKECKKDPHFRWGSRCEFTCPENCAGGGQCDRETGTCKCRPGFFGGECTPCPEQCSDMCNDDGECGTGCLPGSWGATCDQKCHTHCRLAPNGEPICDQETGDCEDECQSGFCGKDCTTVCPENTLQNCDLDTCDSFGCKPPPKGEPGWWGDKCDKICPANCKGGTCMQIPHFAEAMETGECVVGENGGCVDDKWMGHDCSQPCPEGCGDGKCNQLGECFMCKEGLFGNQCEQDCNANCVGGCNRRSGKCAKCTSGFWGDTCIQKCHPRCHECLGATHDMCTTCDPNEPAMVKHKGNTRMGKCKCVEEGTRSKRWDNDDQVLFGEAYRRKEKCFCSNSFNKDMQSAIRPTDSGFPACSDVCPGIGAVMIDNRCYPGDVPGIVRAAGGHGQQGRCGNNEFEINFAGDGECVYVETLLKMYSHDKKMSPAEPTQGNCRQGYGVVKSICMPAKYYDAAKKVEETEMLMI